MFIWFWRMLNVFIFWQYNKLIQNQVAILCVHINGWGRCVWVCRHCWVKNILKCRKQPLLCSFYMDTDFECKHIKHIKPHCKMWRAGLLVGGGWCHGRCVAKLGPLHSKEEEVEGMKGRLAELLFMVKLLRKVLDSVVLCILEVAAETIGWLWLHIVSYSMITATIYQSIHKNYSTHL